MCEDSIPGIQSSNVCCPASCGSCGGTGCARRDGGLNFSGIEACCGGGVRSLDRDCSVTGAAPCVFPEGTAVFSADCSILSDMEIEIPSHKSLSYVKLRTHANASTTRTPQPCQVERDEPSTCTEIHFPRILNSSSSDLRGGHSWNSSQQRLLPGKLWELRW